MANLPSASEDSTGKLGLLVAIVIGSLVIAVGRFLVPGHDLSLAGSYEAFAHIWVGVLLTLGITRSNVRLEALVALGLITVLETVMFLMR